MKKLLFIIFAFLIIFPIAQASEYKQLPYKNIKDGSKLLVTESEIWTDKVKKNDPGIIKDKSLLYINGEENAYDTDCGYLFIYNGHLLGYSASDLKFYEFVSYKGSITKQELESAQVATVFNDFRIINISDFSEYTNVFTLKKFRNPEKIMILNDTERTFQDYEFTSHNAKFDSYNINNAISITKKGLIQFSKSGEITKYSPWFVILVR